MSHLHIAKYLLDVAQAFNKYYGNVRILEENEEKESRLALVYAVTVVLKEGLRLLGVGAPERDVNIKILVTKRQTDGH